MRKLLLVCALFWCACATAQDNPDDAQVIPADMDQLSLPTVDSQPAQQVQPAPQVQPVERVQPQMQQQTVQTQQVSPPQQQRPTLQKPQKLFKKREYKLWTAFARLGLAFSQGTSYTVKSGGTTGSAIDEKGSASVLLGFELYRELMQYFLLGATLEYSRYGYADPNVAADSHLGFYIMPRGEMYAGLLTFWGALGLGLMRLGVGTTSSSVAPGITVSSSTIGIAISPRVGLEYEFMRDWFAGGELDYTRFSGSVGVGVSGSSSDFSIGFVRHWLTLAARIGMKF